MGERIFSIFTFFLLLSSVACAGQPQHDHKPQTIWQRVRPWLQEQESRAHQNKMQRDAKTTVGPVVRAYHMSEDDRQRSKRILLALSNAAKKAQGNPAIYGFINNGAYNTYSMTDLKKVFEECDDLDAAIDVLEHVYQNAASLHHYIISDRSKKTLIRVHQELVSVAQELDAVAQEMVEIYQLTDGQRLQLIEQLQQQNQHASAQAISVIGSMGELEIKSKLAQLQMAFNKVRKHDMKVRKHGIQRTNFRRWNEDCSSWLAHCAQALDSKSLPTAQEIKTRERTEKKWKYLCNGLDQVRSYDHRTKQYFATIDVLEDRIKKLSDLKEGLEFLAADDATTKNEIKTAYKKAALKYHPDKHKDSEEAKQNFQKLGAAEEYKEKNPKVRVADVQKQLDDPQKVFAIMDKHRQETKEYYPQERKALLRAIHLRSPVRPLCNHYPPVIPTIYG